MYQLILLYSVIFLVLIVVFWLCKMVTFGEAWVKGIWEVFALVLQIFVSWKLRQNKKLKKFCLI